MNIPRQQRFIVIGVLCQGQALEHVAQPCVRLFAIGFGAFNERVKQRTGFGTGWRVREEPGFASHCERPDGGFNRIIVYGQIATVDVSHQAVPAVVQIRQGFAQRLLGVT